MLSLINFSGLDGLLGPFGRRLGRSTPDILAVFGGVGTGRMDTPLTAFFVWGADILMISCLVGMADVTGSFGRPLL